MTTPQTCGACGLIIEKCPTCGGLLCADNCPDRAMDGCTCEKSESDTK